MAEIENKDISFDDAFDFFSGETKEDPADQTSQSVSSEDTSVEANANPTDASATPSEDTSSTSADGTEDSASQSLSVEEALAQAKMWEQKFKSFEGRVNAEAERRRLEQLESQQQFIDALSKAGKDTDNKVDKPSKFKEFAETFPEFAEAIEEILNDRLKNTQESVSKLVDSKIDPFVKDFSKQKVLSHNDRILQKHPDAWELRDSGALEKWVMSLPKFMQGVAMHTMQFGSTEEVIDLLDQYKGQVTKETKTNTDKPTEHASAPTTTLDAVKAGLAVKAGNSPAPSTASKNVNKNDFDAGWEDALKSLGVK